MLAVKPESQPGVAIPAAAATRVTAIVVTYQGLRHVGQCLTSLLASTDEGTEIVVVDNGSTDGTPAFVKAEFPDVQLIEFGRNLGYGAAINHVAHASTAPYLAILNQDLVCRPGWLEHLVSALEADPTAALVTPKILLRADPSLVNACGNAPHFTGLTPCRGYREPSTAFTSIEPIAAVSGAAFVIRRTVFQSLGGFDARFFLYLEDTDLSLRALLAGHRLLLVPEAEVLHEFTPRFTAEKLFWLERNRLAMLLKVFRVRTLLLLSPMLVLVELAVWCFALTRGPRHLVAKARALGSVSARLPDILAHRQRVQATRRRPDRALLCALTAEIQLDEMESPRACIAMALVSPLLRGWYAVCRTVVHW